MTLIPVHESNDCHHPAGSPQGGQFCARGGAPRAAFRRAAARAGRRLTTPSAPHRTGSVPRTAAPLVRPGVAPPSLSRPAAALALLGPLGLLLRRR